jgi:creatinine amidohydrolase
MNMKAQKVLLYEMSWPDAKKYFSKNDIALVPVGSNEQHGPANPLGTDHLIAKSIAEETARRTRVICLQVVPFGVSPHHRQFWGTISISPKIFKEYIEEVCLSLNYYGVRKIVIVNGHGGNLAPLTELARELREKGIFVTIFQWWTATSKLLPRLFEPDERHHAGAEETSMNLALHPNLVDMDKLVDEEDKEHVLHGPGITLPLSTVDETSSGVYAKGSTASVKKGKKVFEATVGELVRHVNLLRKAKMEDLLPKPKV